MSRLDDLKAKRAAAEASARAAALTEDEQAEQAELAAIEKAKEERATAEAARRASALAQRVEAAEIKAAGAYLVTGVDLVALFPLGKAPEAHLPPGGVVIVRDPTQKASDALTADVEVRKKGGSRIAIEMATACTVDPDPGSPEGAGVRAFYERYQEAAGVVAQKARELGGAKAQQDKRGGG